MEYTLNMWGYISPPICRVYPHKGVYHPHMGGHTPHMGKVSPPHMGWEFPELTIWQQQVAACNYCAEIPELTNWQQQVSACKYCAEMPTNRWRHANTARKFRI